MHDVAIIGGGPAGLIAAICAAERGLDTVVFEPKTMPIDKACGEGLMPGVRTRLEELGVRLDGHPFEGIIYQHVARRDRRARGAFSHGTGLGVRRTTLHGALSERAADLGVVVRPEKVERLTQDDAGVTLNDVRARYALGADGLHSWTRRELGVGIRDRRRAPRFGIRRHFAKSPWTPHVVVYWGPDFEAYVTPVSDASVGVAFLFEPRERFADLLERAPLLRERLGDAEPITEAQGAGPFEVAARQVACGRVLLIGDASGYVDPLTGEGVAMGLATAEAAIAAIAKDDPASYARRWRRATRRSRLMTAGLLHATGVGVIRRALIPTLSVVPKAFDVALDLFDVHA